MMAGTVGPDVAPTTIEDPDGPVTFIRPIRGWVQIGIKEIWEYRDLLRLMAWRDIKVRYKQTALGATWAVLLFVSGAFYFRRMEAHFADVV